MPTFGYGTGGGSNRSGSRKQEEEKDEFDDILDSIVGKEDTGNRNIDPLPSSDPPRRRPGTNYGSMKNNEPLSLQNSAKKDQLEQKKRAMFGITSSSDEKERPKRNVGPRSQVSPDDGHRGISTKFDKDGANSSLGRNATNNSGGFEASPIGVIETNKSRRIPRRKEPAGGASIPKPLPRSKTADTQPNKNQNTNSTDKNRFERNVVSPPNFHQRPDTGPTKKTNLINKIEDDDSFDRDDDQDILDLMEVADSKEGGSKVDTSPKKQDKPKVTDEDEDDMDDLFSGGGGYVPSTLSKNMGDEKKGDASNEATPNSRLRRPLTGINNNSGSKQRDSRDSFSPPDFGEESYNNKNAQNKFSRGKALDQPRFAKKNQSAIPTISSSNKLGNQRETSVPLDELSRAKMEYEETQNKTADTERRMKREIENLRLDQKKDVQNLESQYNQKVESHNREIKRLVDEMNFSIKQEREKLEVINKTEIENRKKQHELELQRQKDVFGQQNQVFENQLQQQIEMNKMLEQVRTSSNNIDSTLSQLNDDKGRGLEFQIDELKKRERDLNEKLKSIEYQAKEADSNIEKAEKEILDIERQQEELRLENKRQLELNKESIWKEEAEFNLERINKEIKELQEEYEDKINAVELERKVVL